MLTVVVCTGVSLDFSPLPRGALITGVIIYSLVRDCVQEVLSKRGLSTEYLPIKGLSTSGFFTEGDI